MRWLRLCFYIVTNLISTVFQYFLDLFFFLIDYNLSILQLPPQQVRLQRQLLRQLALAQPLPAQLRLRPQYLQLRPLQPLSRRVSMQEF